MTSAGHHVIMQGADPVGPSARDYPQQGLVRLWDAIENAGWGTHAENPNRWIDCVIGAALDTADFSSIISLPRFLPSSVYFDGVDNALTANNPLAGSYSEFSIQIPLSTQSGTTTYWVPFTTYTGTSSSERIQINVEGTPRVHIVQLRGIQTVNIGSNSLADKTGSITLVWTSSNSKLTVWFKGQLKGQMNMSSFVANTLVFTKPQWNIGGDFQVARDSFFCGDIFGLRIYNRALTDAEIVQSAQLDAARFSIPA